MSDRVLAARNLTLKQMRRAQNRARYTWKVAVEAVKDTMHAVGHVQESVSNRTVNASKEVFRAVRRPLRASQKPPRRGPARDRVRHAASTLAAPHPQS